MFPEPPTLVIFKVNTAFPLPVVTVVVVSPVEYPKPTPVILTLFTPEVKPPAKKTIKQNQNIFSYFDQCDECDDEYDDDCMIYDINNIIWGVGQKDMIGVKWADVC